ncbi:MAG: chemotaxis-specific protein-glutamate methyltransferase CheB [Anaerolineae bacterium]
MAIETASRRTKKSRTGPIRVVVVEDSPTVRMLLVNILQAEADLEVVAVGADGEEALRLAHRMRPDVLTIDVRMPKMDGLEATRHIMREVPTPIVIVTGNLMRADVDITFEALQAGALSVVHTPGLADPAGCARVVQTVRLMADVPVVHHWGRRGGPGPAPMAPPARPSGADGAGGAGGRRPRMIGIAASTGGPGTLASILRALPAEWPIPVLVVQHVSRGFVGGLAEWLNTQTALHVALANHGHAARPGSVLIAPDDYHLQINAGGIVELCHEPAYRGLRPSANYLFRSLAMTFGPTSVGIILTGMGDDGVEGLAALRAAGGLTIAQNEASCVVYGMPRQAVALGAAEHVLAPEEIVSTLLARARMDDNTYHLNNPGRLAVGQSGTLPYSPKLLRTYKENEVWMRVRPSASIMNWTSSKPECASAPWPAKPGWTSLTRHEFPSPLRHWPSSWDWKKGHADPWV